jgi:hypothetical protein
MKMADGGFRPPYNVQMVTAGSPLGGPRTIVGSVTNLGSDMGWINPLLEQVEQRTGQLPTTLLADANHAAQDCIRCAAAAGVEVLVPVPERTVKGGAQAADDPAMWRGRSAWKRRKQRSSAVLARACASWSTRTCACTRRRQLLGPRTRHGHLRRADGRDHIEPAAARGRAPRIERSCVLGASWSRAVY